MMSGNGSCRLPFTAVQWQELEHQALFFKYMVSGLPIPPDLLFSIRRSFESSHSSKFLLQQPHHIGWNSFHMGFGRKVDPEPGRCRRTDGKKWRCSKDAYSDSKYCERHMHRGRNRSRKPVEIEIMSPAKDTISSPHNSVLLGSSINNKKRNSSSPSTTTPEIGLSFQDYRKSSGDGDMDSEASSNCSWQLGPLTMGSPLSQMKQKAAHFSELQQKKQVHHYYNCDMHLSIERDDHQPKKVMHHFLDESPPKDKHSWLNYEDKMSIHSTQLSISTPNSLHDFFATQKW